MAKRGLGVRSPLDEPCVESVSESCTFRGPFPFPPALSLLKAELQTLRRCGSDRAQLSSFGCCQVFFALSQAFEEFVAFAATADENVFVLKHRLDDAQDRFRAQIVG